jgi:hypothetical protein
MRFLTAIAAILVAAPAAAAQEPTTLHYVTTKGVVMKLTGLDIPVVYTPDGKFTAMHGAITGTWKVNGDVMCSKNSIEPNEVCITYPAGKKPGDEFELAGPQGPFAVQINK